MLEKTILKKLIDVAAGRKPADLVLKNARIVNVEDSFNFGNCLFIAIMLINQLLRLDLILTKSHLIPVCTNKVYLFCTFLVM